MAVDWNSMSSPELTTPWDVYCYICFEGSTSKMQRMMEQTATEPTVSHILYAISYGAVDLMSFLHEKLENKVTRAVHDMYRLFQRQPAQYIPPSDMPRTRDPLKTLIRDYRKRPMLQWILARFNPPNDYVIKRMFGLACSAYQIESARWIYNMKPELFNIPKIFIDHCEAIGPYPCNDKRRIIFLKWLASLNDSCFLFVKGKYIRFCVTPLFFSTEEKSVADIGDCPICLEKLRIDESRVTNCGHHFCDSCLYDFKTYQPSIRPPCPICRHPLERAFQASNKEVSVS